MSDVQSELTELMHGRASVVGPHNLPDPDRVAEHKPMPGPEPQRVAGPFSGVLVIDLTHVLNGPFGTTILTDLGARVIKIEPPGHGDDTRTFGPFYKGQSLYFSFVNRGKESITLNLKEDADRAIFLNMVRQAAAATWQPPSVHDAVRYVRGLGRIVRDLLRQ